MATYIKVIKGKYEGLSGYLDENLTHNAATLYDKDCRKILTSLKKDEFKIVTPKVIP